MMDRRDQETAVGDGLSFRIPLSLTSVDTGTSSSPYMSCSPLQTTQQ